MHVLIYDYFRACTNSVLRQGTSEVSLSMTSSVSASYISTHDYQQTACVTAPMSLCQSDHDMDMVGTCYGCWFRASLA